MKHKGCQFVLISENPYFYRIDKNISSKYNSVDICKVNM